METVTVASDPLTGWGTVGLAVVTVVGLVVTVCQAKRDRRDAARRLAEERVRHRKDLVRADHLRYLLDAAEQYARFQGAGELSSEQVEAKSRLLLALHLLPKRNAILLKYRFGAGLTDGEQEMLKVKFPDGIVPRAKVPENMIYAELADNADSISHYGRR